MIDANARCAHGALAQQLRPFIARRVGVSADVDDVLQDVFLRMQRALPTLRHNERFGPWVYQIARSAIVDYQRVNARQRRFESLPDDETLGAVEERDETPTEPEERLVRAVGPFVAMLATPYREALILTELQGVSQKEAASMLGISLSGMKSRVQRGRAQLRELLEACCEIGVDARGRVISCEQRKVCPTDGCG